MSGNGPRTGSRSKHEADAPKACCIPRKSARRPRGRQLRPVSARRSGFRARSSRAARICARRTIAAAIGRRRAMPKPIDTSTSHVGFRCVKRTQQRNNCQSSQCGRSVCMPSDTDEEDDTKPHRTRTKTATLNRRNILLGSSALVAAAAMTSGALAQAQKAAPAAPAAAPAPAPAAASGRKPNILIIWGDDVGVANISAYSNGLMGYETPNIDRIGREGHQVPALLRRAVMHRRPRGVPHRSARHPHRPDQGRLSRRADGHEPARSVDRRPAQESRLRHRAVRQEPCRRPQRIRCRP